MKLYWPCAMRLKDDGRQEPVSTYDACASMAEARKQIALWRDWYHFRIVDARIDVYDRGTKIQTIQVKEE